MAERVELDANERAFLEGKPEMIVKQGEAPAPVEPAAEPPAEPTPAAPETPAAEQEKFFELINKRFSAGYKSDEEVETAFKSLARTADYDAKVKEASEYKTKLDGLTNEQKQWLADKQRLEAQINPLQFFRDEKAFIAEQLKRQFPDKDPVVMERLMTADLSRTDKVELLAQKLLLDTPDFDGGIDGARELVLSELGVEVGSKPEEWDRLTKNKLTVKANAAKKELEELKAKANVEIPKIKSQEELQAEVTQKIEGLKQKWSPVLDRMEAADKLQIPGEDGTVLTTFDIPAEWRQTVRNELLENILAAGLEPTEDTIRELNAVREMKFLHSQFPKLYKVLESQWSTRAIEERDKLLNNTNTPNETIRPEGTEPVSNDAVMRDFLNH